MDFPVSRKIRLVTGSGGVTGSRGHVLNLACALAFTIRLIIE